MQIVPTLNFSGKCREAIQMYAKAFGGEITCLISYGDANDPAYMPLLQDNQNDYIYHAELKFGDRRITMSDHVDIDIQVCYSNFLTIIYDTKEDFLRKENHGFGEQTCGCQRGRGGSVKDWELGAHTC